MRQAVVVIHGIGEQRPMDVLRSFVSAVLPQPEEGSAFFSKPDRMSELFELRRLRGRGRLATDFYEYYWAYLIEGTSIFDVARWLFELVRRSRHDVPRTARSLWLATRTLLVLILIALLLGPISAVRDWIQDLQVFGVLSFAIAGAASYVQWVTTVYLGDAARYLSPHPKNIRLRQKIRRQGTRLLRTLHERSDYSRIILVGHSLGSVIGYDLITHLWQEYHEDLPGLKKPSVQGKIRECLAAGVSPQPHIRDKLPVTGDALHRDSNDEEIARFQLAQRDAWREQRLYANPWKVTDFITLGSPLAHAMLLLARGRDDFDDRKRQRELPTCPPQRDDKGFAFSPRRAVEIGEGKLFTPLILHHAAPFAVTRWTNLYFPVKWGLFGDIVGGPLREVFGWGIRDIQVHSRKWGGFANHTVAAHTAYWLSEDEGEEEGRPLALDALRNSLALTHLRGFKRGSWEQLTAP